MPYKNLHKIPVYRSALELRSISREIASYVSYNKEVPKLFQSNSLRDHIAGSLVTDAVLIPEHIAKAENSQSEAIRLKSATLINIMIRNIISYCNGLEKDGVKEKEYLNLLRQEIAKFRKSYNKWRRSMRNPGGDGTLGFNDYLGY